MKLCSKCGENKHLSDFNKSSRNLSGVQGYCRACSKLHYLRNSNRHAANVKLVRVRRMREAREYIVNIMLSGCVDCGNKDIRVLEFDHLKDKFMNVSTMVRNGYSMDKLRVEVAKCEIRCRNCHFIKTTERIGGSWRDNYLGS